MNTVGYLFIFSALFIIRGISRGRVRQLPEDIGDAFTAAVSGDGAALTEVFNRKGEGLEASVPREATQSSSGESGLAPAGEGLLASARKRGKGATYSQAARTGPTSYDCSGLVYMAMKDNGYTGANFWTGSFKLAAKAFITKVDPAQATVNDIVWWPGHMGIVSGPNLFYSALNKKTGIKDTKISSHKNAVPPAYYRFTVAAKGAGVGQGSGGGGGGSW
jgi:hypothetical protein